MAKGLGFLKVASVAAVGPLTAFALSFAPQALAQASGRPNILVIFGDDIGVTNVSAYSQGLVGYRAPNIDRIAKEGMMFTDYYAEQSCTAGRSAFITGIATLRTGLSKVGAPGATLGLQVKDPTVAELLKPLGYTTGQFGKNHLGDRNEYLPTVHGFDEFFGNLYHLNAEEDPDDWTHSQWTVPINATVSKLTRIGKRAVSFGIGARYYADSPDTGPHAWGARATVTFLFPE
jgi:arylsulfatase A-like enzyme